MEIKGWHAIRFQQFNMLKIGIRDGEIQCIQTISKPCFIP